MRFSHARAVARHLQEWGVPAQVSRRGRTYVLLVVLADGRTAVWGEAGGGRLRALLYRDEQLTAVLPATDRARTAAQCAAVIAHCRYGPAVTITAPGELGEPRPDLTPHPDPRHGGRRRRFGRPRGTGA